MLKLDNQENILNCIYDHFNDKNIINTIWENGYNVNLIIDEITIQYKFNNIKYQNKNNIDLHLKLKIGTSCNLYHISRNNINIYLHINGLMIICFNTNQLEGLIFCLKEEANINYLLKYDQINSGINNDMYDLLSLYDAKFDFNLLSKGHLLNIINNNNHKLFIYLVENYVNLHKRNYLIDDVLKINVKFIESLLNFNSYNNELINFVILQLLTVYYK